MKKLKTAIIGTGFMGKVHAENVRRLGNVEIAAVAASSDEKARGYKVHWRSALDSWGFLPYSLR